MGSVTTDRTADGGEPTEATSTRRMLFTLLDHGRWDDAATYCPALEDPAAPAFHAKLLLAAGRTTEAGRVLATLAGDDDPQLAFLQHAHSVLTHDGSGLPHLIASATDPDVATDPLINLVMVRAARAAGRPQVAAHYATQVLTVSPGDVEASLAVVLDLVATGNYVNAVHVIDTADAWHCDDDPHPLDRALDALESADQRPKAAALAVVGDYMHREADPTLAVPPAEQASRHRWRTARRERTRRVPLDTLILWAAACVVGGIGFALMHNALLGMVCIVLVGSWLARRPIPGVDPASSQLVRALRNPTTRLNNRQYHVSDVITFLLTYAATLGVVSTLPMRAEWAANLALFGGLVLACAATRGRRRWIRRERTRLLRPTLDPAVCSCLDLNRLHGDTAQHYVDAHLFPVHAVADLPGWDLLQCLETYRYFLSCPAAGLTIALAR